MSLSLLEVRNLRNLASVSITPSPHLNLLFGANGSGKTSILEAIHILGLGRSFRTQQARKLIKDGSTQSTIFGRVESDGRLFSFGIQKSASEASLVKIDGQVVSSAAGLAELLPLQLLTPESHELLQGEPGERRAYMDWGLFHVEHGYLALWRRYRRVLQQRNAALRARKGSAEMYQWDRALAEAGEIMARQREEYVTAVSAEVIPLYKALVGGDVPTLNYRRGWTRDMTLQDALIKNRDSEMSLGHTLAGPHRADLRLQIGGRDSVDILSRGQQKLAVCAMRIGQSQHLKKAKGLICTVLVDDLPAELDMGKRATLMEVLAQTGSQCFVTATERDLVDRASWQDWKLFHVEHGVVKEVV